MSIFSTCFKSVTNKSYRKDNSRVSEQIRVSPDSNSLRVLALSNVNNTTNKGDSLTKLQNNSSNPSRSKSK